MNRIFLIALLLMLILPVFGQEYKIINTKINKEIEKVKKSVRKISEKKTLLLIKKIKILKYMEKYEDFYNER